LEFTNRNIKCNIFSETEVVIRNSEAKIKETKNLKERKYYAQDILLEARSLLSCSNNNDKNLDCLICHSIALKYIHQNEYLAKNVRKIVVIK